MDLNTASFGRVVNVKIFATISSIFSGTPFIDYNNGYTQFSSVQPDGSQGYRIRGRVNKIEAALTVIPNPISLSIYNLGPDSRAIVESKVGTKILVEAGYNKSVKQIFTGNILWAKTHKSGPDFITEIQAGDGSFAVTNGQINLSFDAGTSYETVINALIDSLEPVQLIRGVIKGIPSGAYNQGIVLIGSPLDNLKQICDKIGLHMSVQNGGINILPLGEDLGNTPVDISQDTGLIGIPELRTQGLIGPAGIGNQNTPDNILSFKHLLRPELELFQKVNIQSKFVNGLYTIARSTHDFDSWEGPFFTECECVGI